METSDSDRSQSAAFAEAVQSVLDQNGTEILQEPRQFLASLQMHADSNSIPMRVMQSMCDADLLKPLTDTLQGKLSHEDAKMRLRIILVQVRSIREEIAEPIVEGLVDGLAWHQSGSHTPLSPQRDSKNDITSPPLDDVAQSHPLSGASLRTIPPQTKVAIVLGAIVCMTVITFVCLVPLLRTSTSQNNDSATQTSAESEPEKASAITELSHSDVFGSKKSADGDSGTKSSKTDSANKTNAKSSAKASKKAGTISFDPNGAPKGSTKTVTADDDGSAKLPECGFKYAYREFVGWDNAANGSGSWRAGSTYQVGSKDVTLYAIWRPEPQSICNALEVEELSPISSEYGYTLPILVTNKSDISMNFEAAFTFLGSDGATLDTQSCPIGQIAPNETRLAYCLSFSDGISRATYEFKASESHGMSISEAVEVEESSVEGNHLGIRIHNKSDSQAYLSRIQVLGRDGTRAVIYNWFLAQELAPGETKEIAEDTDASISWQDLSRSYFVDGFIL